MTGTAPLCRRMAVVAPVFNDWVCAQELLNRLATLAPGLPPLSVYLVDDGSTQLAALDPGPWAHLLRDVRVIHAGANLGHQRAIAVGLTQALLDPEVDLLVVIDADGEDDPTGIPSLLAALPESTEAIVVAQRKQRTEALSFRAFYRLYRAGFTALTGKRLDFGNFSLLTRVAATRLVYMPEMWNHFPAAVMRSKVPLMRVPTDRSNRFHGTSRMNFVALVNHGLAAISTFTDVVFARLMTVVSILVTIFLLAAVAVVAIRFGSTVAIPGWTTTAMGFILLGLFQFLTLLAVMTFTLLSARSNVPSIPVHEAPKFIRSIERIQA